MMRMDRPAGQCSCGGTFGLLSWFSWSKNSLRKEAFICAPPAQRKKARDVITTILDPSARYSNATWIWLTALHGTRKRTSIHFRFNPFAEGVVKNFLALLDSRGGGG